jgi:hypothetical protein
VIEHAVGLHGAGACGGYCAEVRDTVIWGMIRTQCIQHDMGKYMRIGTWRAGISVDVWLGKIQIEMNLLRDEGRDQI